MAVGLVWDCWARQRVKDAVVSAPRLEGAQD